jgi:hypothetical protein
VSIPNTLKTLFLAKLEAVSSGRRAVADDDQPHLRTWRFGQLWPRCYFRERANNALVRLNACGVPGRTTVKPPDKAIIPRLTS